MPIMTFQARKVSGGWNAVVSLPVLPQFTPGGFPPGSPLRVVAKDRATKAGAIQDAASIASKLASNPILAAMLPPGTGAAVAVTEKLMKAVGLGNLDQVAKNLVGKGAKRLAKKLKFW